jgi:hypothetical protein
MVRMWPFAKLSVADEKEGLSEFRGRNQYTAVRYRIENKRVPKGILYITNGFDSLEF